MEQKRKRSELPEEDRSHDKRSHTERESETESSLTSVKTGPELEASNSPLTSPIRESEMSISSWTSPIRKTESRKRSDSESSAETVSELEFNDSYSSPSSPSVSTSSLSDLDSDDKECVRETDLYFYEFKRTLAPANYGSVYLAKRGPDNDLVAIKAIKIGVGYTNSQTLERECLIIGRLTESSHQNMLTFYEILRSDNKTRAYIVSEFSEMGDLFEMTKQMTNTGEKVWVPLSELKARHLIRGIAEGLKHLHSIGIAHGDLKPDNILIFRNMLQNETTLQGRERFDRYLPKITDFSNSRIRESTDPENQILCRTPTCTIYYAAPESDMGLEYDMIRADLFSVGCCLLAMLLAAYPFKPHIDWPNSFWPNFQQKSIQYKSLSNEMKKDSAYSYGLCKVFNTKLRQVLLKLIDPNPESRLTLNQFLADQWFTRN